MSVTQMAAPLCEAAGAGHQLVIETVENTLIVGMADDQLALKWVTALVQALAECAPVPKFVVGPAVSQSGIDCWSWSFPAILKPRRREMFCFDEIDNTHALTNG